MTQHLPAEQNRVGGGWVREDVTPHEASWRRAMPPPVVRELIAAAAKSGDQKAGGTQPALPLQVLPASKALATHIRKELRTGFGFTVLTGFPVDEDPSLVERAYLLFGRLLGRPVSQNRWGDLIGRVEDVRLPRGGGKKRGYTGSDSLSFHADRTDVVTLLCIRQAAAGGVSRLASVPAVHNVMLDESPESWAELCRPLPNDLRGEAFPGFSDWHGIPVFSMAGSSLVMRYLRIFIEKSQRYPDAPGITPDQRRAMDRLDAILARPEMSVEMTLAPGDVQVIDNFRTLHARTAFVDSPGAGTRLLLRLWLASADSPELPAAYRPLYGATRAGSFRGGVWPAGVTPDQLGEPLRSPAGAEE
ncbi:TauD/TfdA family dioxygenase [Streptomyces sp. NPDC102467]|uniref:TauD/TfdA family dioxygenase n=1 Tax=Streptomyces sp. NPDC102467 TaxID=3366179 RepID=UPI00380F87BC